MIRSCEHYNVCRKPVTQCNSKCNRLLPHYKHDIEQLKKRKREFINALIADNIQYRLCKRVSEVLNEALKEMEGKG